MDTTDITGIRNEYFEQLYANKFGNSSELDKFCEGHIS